MPAASLRQASLGATFAASLSLCHSAQAQTHFDAVKDFSLKANPNGAWTYKAGTTPPVPSAHEHGVPGLESWSNGGSGSSEASIVLDQGADPAAIANTGSPAPRGFLVFHGGESGAAVLEFTASNTGTYAIKGDVRGVGSQGMAAARLLIVHAGKTLWSGKVAPGDDSRIRLGVELAQGDTLDFIAPGHGQAAIGVSAKVTAFPQD